QSEIKITNDTLNIHINPDKLILNKKEWNIEADNDLKLAKKFIEFRNFILSRNNQKLAINTSMSNQQKENLSVAFENFRLSTLTSLFNPEQSLANGLLEGEVVVENPFDDSGMLGDLTINNLEVMEVPLGTFKLNATSKNRTNYDFDLSLKGENA